MYDQYITIDWSQKNAVIASYSPKSGETKTFEIDAELKVLRAFLRSLKGSKVLTFEEGSSAQWLYVELRDLVDDLIVCDPYRNHLLKDGAKNDKNDALKLLQLLRADLLRNVLGCANDDLIYMRFLAKGYENLIKSGVAIKNQMKAIIISRAPNKDTFHQFVLKGLRLRVDLYEAEKKRFRTEFKRLGESHRSVRELLSVPGIGLVGAVFVASRVVNAKRFCNKGQFLSYCGLIRLEKTSGGKSYGTKMPRLVLLLLWISIPMLGCNTAPVQKDGRNTRLPSSTCDVINTDESTVWISNKTILKKTITYLISFENLFQFKPSECFSAAFIEGEGKCLCNRLQQLTREKTMVEFSIVNLSKDWESSKIILRGKCEESNESTFSDGNLKKLTKFIPEGIWTLTKPLP